ncbi:MAG: EF-hand domain-containing protein [Janthinobacterium lividum]
MRLPTAILAAVVLLSSPAIAQRGQRGGGAPSGDTPAARPQPPAGSERATIMAEPVGMLIAGFDTDGDGRTSRAELAAGVTRTFRSIDTADTGRLGYIEFADWAERWLGDRNALPSPFTVDTNADNVITPDELQAAIAHIYDRFDQKKDGMVTRAELLTIHDAPGIGGGGGGRSGGASGGGRRGGRHGGGGGMGGGGMGGGGMGG